MQSDGHLQVVRFGVFQVDLASGELRKNDLRIKVQGQPFQVLALLLRNPGSLVTRDQLRHEVWPGHTFVDFDHALNTAIKKIRIALGDDAAAPRYIETIPKRGYRFLPPVNSPTAPKLVPRSSVPTPRYHRWSVILLLFMVFLGVVSAYVSRGAHLVKAHEDRVTLAVLPFANYSRDPQQNAFCDGLTEEVIAQLGRWNPQRLGVTARTSTQRYGGTNKAIDEIGRDLRVQYVLEGSVRSESGRIRVTAQLIRVSDQTHVWAEDFDRPYGGEIDLQSDISAAVAQQVTQRLVLASK
jgi:TolB-like protein/DNA-binding winged helix-turn-helix (wHTH) protein